MIAKTAEIGRELSYAGFGIVFGGGRLGLMGAVAKAAIEANGSVIGIIPKGLTSREPIQQQLNELFVVDDIIERKRMMMEKSDAFLILPGGLGTLDELFEALTLIQTGKIHDFPVVLMGTSYWQPLIAQLDEMVDKEMIDSSDLELLLVTDDVSAALAHIETHAVHRFRLHHRLQPIRVLGETAV